MGKKPQRHSWPEAVRLCWLNRNDVEMAKRLGFRPDTLIRSRPDRRQGWKLPVNAWVRELHRTRFGYVLGEKPLPAPAPVEVELDEDAMRQFEEELFWEDYWARNDDDTRPKKRESSRAKPASPTSAGAGAGAAPSFDAVTGGLRNSKS